MEADYVHKDTLTATDYVELNKNNELLISYNQALLKENQELKEKLDKYENPEDMTLFAMWCTEKVKDENEKLKKKYENAVADYETTMFEKEQLNSLVNSCQEEIRQLKKQVEDLFNENRNLRKKLENCMTFEDYKYTLNKKIKLETQQKEFIKYLEDEIKLYKNDIQNFSKDYNVYFSLINDLRVSKAKIGDILKKYKSIIGDDK